jgi:hypothetical protein
MVLKHGVKNFITEKGIFEHDDNKIPIQSAKDHQHI